MEIRLSQFHDSDSLVLTRHTLPSGDYVWNREDDDTPNVRRVNGRLEKPRDFDPFGQTGFAHLWLQYN